MNVQEANDYKGNISESSASTSTASMAHGVEDCGMGMYNKYTNPFYKITPQHEGEG
jgi:hypothetical protein